MDNHLTTSPQNTKSFTWPVARFSGSASNITLAAVALLALGAVGCKKSSASTTDETKTAMEQVEATKRAVAEAQNKKTEEARRQREAENARRIEEKGMQADRAKQEQVEKERQATAGKEEAAKLAQVESLKVAAEAFGTISLNPQITLAGALKREGVTAELKGQDLEKFRALCAAKDWLGILKALGRVDEDANDFPPVKDVRTGAEEFARSKTFPLLIKAPLVKGDQFLATVNELSYWLVSFPESKVGFVTKPIDTRHPDGIGYIVDWYPALGNVVIVAATHETFVAQTRQIDSVLTKLREGLETKIRLGEINNEDAQKQLAETQKQCLTRFLAWAETATLTLKPTLSGIGVSIVPKGNVVEVTEIVAGGPAEKSGELRVGDRIIAIADNTPDLFGKIDIPEKVSKAERNRQFNEIIIWLRGAAGRAVYLKVQPAGTDDPSKVKQVKIIRGDFSRQ